MSQSLLDRMKAKAAAIKEKQAAAQQGPLAPRWDLTGKNTIVAPGHEVIVRFLPRWDFAHKYVRTTDGKVALNPKYVDDFIYFEALEHWWDVTDDKGGTRPTREWCPRTFDKAAQCPLCDVSDELVSSASPDDRKAGKRMASKEVFLFNAVVGGAGKRKMTEKGLPDIRIMPLQETLLVALSGIMTGGETEEGAGEGFARGDVSDIKDGYNLKLIRPAAQGDRWKMDCSPKPSPLYTPEEREVWKTWVSLLHNIPKVVEEELKDYAGLYKAFHGVTPEDMQGVSSPAPATKPGKAGPAKPAPKAASVGEADEFAASGAPEDGGAAPEEPDLGFELPPDPDTAPVPGKAGKPGKK